MKITWCWAAVPLSICPRVAGQELVLAWWFGGGVGLELGPGLRGPLSREFSLLWTPGDLLPTGGGSKNEGGKFLMRSGIPIGIFVLGLTTANILAISSSESDLTWMMGLLCCCWGSSLNSWFCAAILIVLGPGAHHWPMLGSLCPAAAHLMLLCDY